MNFIKSDLRNQPTDECNAACIVLKVTNYKPINKLASSIQQQKSHQNK